MKPSMNKPSEFAKSVVVACVLALGGSAISSQALAEETSATATPRARDLSVLNSSVASYPVRFADLDVSTVKGARILYLRVRYAAQVVCESAATWGEKDKEACVRKAVNDAVSHLNRPLLSQYHQQRTSTDSSGIQQLAKAN